jgi:hypothetical protein
MLRELRAMGNVTSRLVWCVRPRRLAAYSRQMDVMAPLRAVPGPTNLLAVEYIWAKIPTRKRKTRCACELTCGQVVGTGGRARDGGAGVWPVATLVGVMKQARKDAPGALRNEDVGSASSTNGTDASAAGYAEKDGALFSEQKSAGERGVPVFDRGEV